MKRQMLKIAVLAMVMGAAWQVVARAQEKSSTDKKPAEAMMQMPAPGPEMERIKFLIGTWDVNAEYEKSPMMPQGGKETGWYKAQLGPGGYSILADFEEEGPVGKEIGHQIISWDPKQKAYIAITVGNSFPGAVMGTSRWEGENLVTDAQFEEAGVITHTRSTYSNITAKSTHMEEAFQGPDGTYQALWKADATKK